MLLRRCPLPCLMVRAKKQRDEQGQSVGSGPGPAWNARLRRSCVSRVEKASAACEGRWLHSQVRRLVAGRALGGIWTGSPSAKARSHSGGRSIVSVGAVPGVAGSFRSPPCREGGLALQASFAGAAPGLSSGSVGDLQESCSVSGLFEAAAGSRSRGSAASGSWLLTGAGDAEQPAAEPEARSAGGLAAGES